MCIESVEGWGSSGAPGGRGDVVTSRVLEALDFIEEFGWCAIDDAVAVVSCGSDEGVDQGLGSSIKAGHLLEAEPR